MRKPLREALQVIADITDELSLTKPPADKVEAKAFLKEELEKARTVVPSLKGWGRSFPSLTCSIATGIGKTRLMAAAIYYLNKVHNIKHFFILAPNLTLYEKLLRDFGDDGSEKYVFRGLSDYVANPPHIVAGDNYLSAGARGLFSESIEINIFNIAKFNKDTKASRRKGQPSLAPRMMRLSEYLGQSYYAYLSSLPDLVILMDEAHRYYADASRKAVDELRPLLGIEMTATPLKDGEPVSNIIYEYNLAQALHDGLYVKHPKVAKRRDFSTKGLSPAEIERVKLEDALSLHQHTAAELELYARDYDQPLVKPFVLVVCRDISHAADVTAYLESDDFYRGRYRGKVLQVDSSTKKEDEVTELFLSLESSENPIEIVVHVNMLGEGWDVKNLYTIVPLRAANAVTLVEQTIGRGLRLPFGGKRTGRDNIDTLTIIAHDNFERIVEAAKRDDSILHRVSFVEIDADSIEDEYVKIETFAPVNEPVASYQKMLVNAASDSVQQEARTLIDASEAVYSALSEAAKKTSSASVAEMVQKPDKLSQVVEIAKAKVDRSGSLFVDEVKKVLTVDFVAQEATKFKRNMIEIPRVSVLPKEVTHRLEPFKVDFLNGSFDFDLRKEEIVRQSLVNGEQDLTDVYGSGRIRNARQKFLMALLNEPDIDYSVMREQLLDVVNQVLRYLEEKHGSIESALEVLDQNIQLMAKRLYAQISKHLVVEVMSYGESKVLPFVRIEPVNLAERRGYPRLTLCDPLPSKNQIRRFIFHGFKKACHECYGFDSMTEHDFAIVLENDDEVTTWLRPAPRQFNILWGRESYNYEPDFVVETKEAIYLVETKAYKDLSTQDVLAKADAAKHYCKMATEYTLEHGGKRWEYLLISHLDVLTTYSFRHIRQLSRDNLNFQNHQEYPAEGMRSTLFPDYLDSNQ